jgi:hypothetical protein
LEMRDLAFCPGWPGPTILLISASQVAGITGVSHHTWRYCRYFWQPCQSAYLIGICISPVTNGNHFSHAHWLFAYYVQVCVCF